MGSYGAAVMRKKGRQRSKVAGGRQSGGTAGERSARGMEKSRHGAAVGVYARPFPSGNRHARTQVCERGGSILSCRRVTACPSAPWLSAEPLS